MIVVIPCGNRKQDHPVPAGAMYTGAYHKACLRWARSVVPESAIYILSAKYGLLPLDQVIAPYDLTMGQPGSVSAAQVRQQAQTRALLSESVIAVGGDPYLAICQQVWPQVQTPLRGRGSFGRFGYQLQWLKQHYGRLPSEDKRVSYH